MVLVLIPALLAEHTGGQRNLQVATHGTASIGTVLDTLAGEHPILDRRVRDETGAVRRYVNLYLDGTDIRALEGLNTRVREGQEMLIVQSIAGG